MTQYLTALEAANRARYDIAEISREIREGELAAADALYDPRAQPMTLGRLLGAQPRWGEQRSARELHDLKWATGPGLHAIDLNVAMRVRQLTERQKYALALWLDGRR